MDDTNMTNTPLRNALLKNFCFLLMFLQCLGVQAQIKNRIFENFLVIPDIHVNSDQNVKHMDINPDGPSKGLDNDEDSWTLNQIMTKITQGIDDETVATPEFVIFLGDMVRNGMDDSPNLRVADESLAFTTLKDTFSPVPVFYVFGNHDSVEHVWWPFYYLPGHFMNRVFRSPYEVAMSNGWNDGFLSTGEVCPFDGSFTEPCLLDGNLVLGFYSAFLKPHLRMIVLNTPMLDAQAINIVPEMVTIQLEWFVDEMQIARQNNDSVLLVMHVPLGHDLDAGEPNSVHEIVPGYEEQLLQIIADNNDIIIGMIAGHTHMDSMRVFTLGDKRVNFLINPAALSTRNGNAPSFKTIYFYNNNQNPSASSWVLADYDTFNFVEDVPPPPAITRDFELNLLYTFSNYYCERNATSIMSCLDNITVDKMNLYHTAGNPNYSLDIANPQNVFIPLPGNTPPPRPGGGGGSGLWVLGAAAGGAFLGALATFGSGS
jgi:sphingomyelin phosphodiesterase acid-like 3